MVEIIFGLLGGLAIFIFGLKSMSDGLQKAAGKKTHAVMRALTSMPVVGVLIGALITIVTQSSTLVTVMVVGFVNTAMLNLKQAISVIMGANIGTTLTAQLVAFRITDAWVFLAAFGFAAYFISKNKHVKNSGFIMFSLGMVLLGMALMSQAMVPLRGDPVFQQLMLTFSDNRVLGMLVGALFTALVQSSTAATGVIVAMTMQGVLPFEAALPLILGTNIGTTITAVFASIGATLAAKRAALAHVLFNALGVIIFLAFLTQYGNLILAISPVDDVPRQVANAHTMFSVINTLIFLPFIGPFAKLLTKILPGEDSADERGPLYLDWHVVNMPSVALSLAEQEIAHMAELTRQNVVLAMEGFFERDEKKLQAMKDSEEIVDGLEKNIMHYLARISQTGMSDDMSIRHTGLLHATNDIERISDHAENITELALAAIDDDVSFSPEAIEELRLMYNLVTEIYDAAIDAFKNNDKSTLGKINDLEAQIDAMEEDLRASHIRRLKDGRCSADAGVILLDIIINFERMGDHANNVSHVPLDKL